MKKVLIANRAEIAVRIARACRDAGLGGVAVYSDLDRDALHVRRADEAFALGGTTAAETYLDIAKLIAIATRAEADAVHPGYGFLAENADFAQAVVDARLTWIGPPPDAIRILGDKTTARQLAERVGAPLAPGLSDFVSSAEEIEAFAKKAGLPIIIKAAFGGGGRGMRIVREFDEIAPSFEIAVRESTAAFGRGECFVERFLENARHVETQCLADDAGNVVVVSTRDCTLQRRSQKLVEEAPAPFLTDEQEASLRAASKAILKEAGYRNAGTCEFLITADGLISFGEVNTRLQVEHPASEAVTGIDLVREQFRIAGGEEIGYDDPVPHGHAIEFRINGEDAGRNFLPAGGTITRFEVPNGPGIRFDPGYEQGETVPSIYDSLLGKLIVSGATRLQTIERARRALGEFEVEGLPTVINFHRAVVADPAFVEEPFSVHTRWIENDMAPLEPAPIVASQAPEELDRTTVVVEVGGRRVEVSLPADFAVPSGGGRSAKRSPKRHKSGPHGADPGAEGSIVCPMQGTVVDVPVENGAEVAEGDVIVVIEAMKMQQPLAATRAGVVENLMVEVGETVQAGQVLCLIAVASGEGEPS